MHIILPIALATVVTTLGLTVWHTVHSAQIRANRAEAALARVEAEIMRIAAEHGAAEVLG